MTSVGTLVEEVGERAGRLYDDALAPLERIGRDLAHGQARRRLVVQQARQPGHQLLRTAQQRPVGRHRVIKLVYSDFHRAAR